jgi:hypothetical protein
MSISTLYHSCQTILKRCANFAKGFTKVFRMVCSLEAYQQGAVIECQAFSVTRQLDSRV